jgi:putative DNA primase/helicase
MNDAGRAAIAAAMSDAEDQVPIVLSAASGVVSDVGPDGSNSIRVQLDQLTHALGDQDERLAIGFRVANSHRIRRCEQLRKWLWFDGSRLRLDETGKVQAMVRDYCRNEAQKPKVEGLLAEGRKIWAVERLCRVDQTLALTVDQLDADPDVLNTPAGLVDLRTGNVRPTKLSDLATKITAVAPDPPGTPCPTFMAFLNEFTSGDSELASYLQVVSGYALTGHMREHALFFFQGPGGSGKSTFVNTLHDLMGSYSTTVMVEALMASPTDSHSTDIASLRGARLVVASETESHRGWKEARIKQLTGGDPISARFMRGDPFEFRFIGKLMVTGNQKPSFQRVDRSISRRLHLIPFSVEIPEERFDKQLPEKLKAEWPAILRWAIEGAKRWYVEGLKRSQAVHEASRDYLEEEDTLGRWLEEACCLDPNGRERSHVLFQAWSKWAERNREPIGSNIALSRQLQARGFQKKKDPKGSMAFYGLTLRHDVPAADNEGCQ